MNPPETLGVTADTVTATVMQSFSGASKERVATLLQLLVKHSHAFIREADVSHEEWRAGLQFLTDCAKITDDERNEFILLSDILGISSLVDLRSHKPNVTPGSVLGPFHNHDSKWLENGADLINGQPGEPVLVLGSVRNQQGHPAKNASIDFWQNADNALYPAQDPNQNSFNLRCKIKCDAAGRFTLRTINPKPYTVPYDGPVGTMLTASNRHCWRPAHFHLIASADNCQSLVTEIFSDDSQYLNSDAVFGVRPGLTIRMPWNDDKIMAEKYVIASPFRLAEINISLATVCPHPPTILKIEED